jgi:hypothetical protein
MRRTGQKVIPAGVPPSAPHPDTINREAPKITFSSKELSGPATLSGVTLTWFPTIHTGTYYLDKMKANGKFGQNLKSGIAHTGSWRLAALNVQRWRVVKPLR